MSVRQRVSRFVGVMVTLIVVCAVFCLMGYPLVLSMRQTAHETDVRVRQLNLTVQSRTAHLERGVIVPPPNTGPNAVPSLLGDACFLWREQHPEKKIRRVRVTRIEYTIESMEEGEVSD